MRTKTASALAAAALVTAGCGSSPSTPAASNGPKGGIQDVYKFASCMRHHGLSNFPDPVVHQSAGHTEVGLKVTPGLSQSPQFHAAQAACKGFLPGPGPNATQNAAQQRQRRAGFLSFARCMRAAGVSSFPDPDAQGDISRQMLAAANIDVHLPNIQSAAKSCLPASQGLLTAQQLYNAEHSPSPTGSQAGSVQASPH